MVYALTFHSSNRCCIVFCSVLITQGSCQLQENADKPERLRKQNSPGQGTNLPISPWLTVEQKVRHVDGCLVIGNALLAGIAGHNETYAVFYEASYEAQRRVSRAEQLVVKPMAAKVQRDFWECDASI